MSRKIFSKYLTVPLSLVVLASCGGGGGSDPIPAPVERPPQNVAPTIAEIPAVEVMERESITITATAEDSDGEIASYLWQQTSGIELTLETVDSNELTFIAPNITEMKKLYCH